VAVFVEEVFPSEINQTQKYSNMELLHLDGRIKNYTSIQLPVEHENSSGPHVRGCFSVQPSSSSPDAQSFSASHRHDSEMHLPLPHLYARREVINDFTANSI
jgi:hypothetical protein